MCCLSVLYPPSLPGFVLLKLNPVNISSFVRWQMWSFVSRGCCRRKGLSFLVPCACLLFAPVVNSNQHVKDTQSQGCSHLSKFHQHPRRQICSKCQQHSPKQPLRLATPQVPREFCGYPRAAFHFVALLPHPKSLESFMGTPGPLFTLWHYCKPLHHTVDYVTLFPLRSESQPRK